MTNPSLWIQLMQMLGLSQTTIAGIVFGFVLGAGVIWTLYQLRQVKRDVASVKKAVTNDLMHEVQALSNRLSLLTGVIAEHTGKDIHVDAH